MNFSVLLTEQTWRCFFTFKSSFKIQSESEFIKVDISVKRFDFAPLKIYIVRSEMNFTGC